MSRKSRSVSIGSSLDLLLDTMCNAFGCVVLVAMLLAVLAAYTDVRSGAPSAKALEASRRLETRRDALRARVRHLKRVLEQQARNLEVMSKHPGLNRVEELLVLRRKNQTLEKEASDLQQEVTEADARLATAAETRRDLEKRFENVKREGARTARILDKLKSESGRELRLPRLAKVRKAPYWMILKWNNLYLLFPPSDPGPWPASTDAVIVEAHGRYAHFTPVKGKGIDLTTRWSETSEVRGLLHYLPKERWILYFVVAPDSFSQFRKVRDYFVGKGYDYHWYIFHENERKLGLEWTSKRDFDKQ